MTVSERPKIDLPLSKAEIICHIFSLIMLAATFWLVWFFYPQLPDKIVIHFDLSGKANGFGPKTILLLLLILDVVSYAVLTILSRFPHTFNYLRPITEANAPRQYQLARKFLGIISLELTGLMFFVIWSIIQVTGDSSQRIDIVNIITLTVLLSISCGIYMYRSTRSDPEPKKYSRRSR
jgi:uncharacterized membrane protein